MKLVVSRTVFWYLARRVGAPILLVLAAFTLVDLLGEGSDRFAGWFRSGVAIDGFRYLALRVPFMVSQLLPVSILGGVMFAFAILHRAEEVTALQAVGISRLQLAIPIFALAAILTAADFGISEGVAPITNRWAHQLLEAELKHGQTLRHTPDKIWIRTADGFLMAERYDKQRGELEDVTVFRLGSYPDLDAILRVRRAIWNGHEWVLSGVRDLNFKSSGRIEEGDKAGSLDASPSDLTALASSNPDELSLGELDQFIHELKRNRLVPGALLVVRALKFALPFSCFIMAALGLASSLEPTPRRSAIGSKIAFAVAAGVGYWIVLGFTVSLGKSGILPAWPAAWLPNVLFSALALSIFLLGEEKDLAPSN